MSMTNGALVISLDFELYWGMRDVVSIAQYRDNLLGVRQAVPAMLDLFRQQEVHATWATVGMLMFDERADLMRSLPQVRPTYHRGELSTYAGLDAVGRNEQEDPFHFGLSLVHRIAATPHQEVASHTFSHYYCLEAGQTDEQFKADLAAANRSAHRLNIDPKSLVFPRNQFNERYLKLCRSAGIECYRGNETAWMYSARAGDDISSAQRAFRLIDSHVNLSGHHCATPRTSARVIAGEPVDIPASRFLRPIGPQPKRFLDRLRMRRIKQSMAHAANNNALFHLWWHPHNFGANVTDNIAFLREVLEHFARLRKQRKFQSWTMFEAATHAAPDRSAI